MMRIFNPRDSSSKVRLGVRGTIWFWLIGLAALAVVVLGVSWWWTGAVPLRADELRNSSIVWIMSRIVQGDTKALMAGWRASRKQDRRLVIESVARAGMQLRLEGHYGEAEAKLRRGLHLAEDLQQASRDILWMRENLGGTLIAEGKYSAAAEEFRQISVIVYSQGRRREELERQNLITLLYFMKPVRAKEALRLARWGLEQSIETFGGDDALTKDFAVKVEQLEGGGVEDARPGASGH
jgi:tetratricopeptide (TPR) repeat protein